MPASPTIKGGTRKDTPRQEFCLFPLMARGPDLAPGELTHEPEISPDSFAFQVLKKAFQATLKWLLSLSETSGSVEDLQQHKQFLRGALPVLQKRMCSPNWEVRDSGLEFLTLASKHLRGQAWFWQVLSPSEVPALAEGLLDDPESYVRASAAKAVGQLSLMATAGSERPGLDSNGSNKEASAVARLLEILSKDSEGFPRRAVIGVFVDWLREGHPAVLADPEWFVSSVIQAVSGDLDWEVKVSSLELAEVFAAQTFGRLGLVECPYAVDSSSASQPVQLPELVQTFCRVKLFDFLFGALGDCDRPVALRACNILMAVKSKLCKGSFPEEGQRSEEAMPARTAPCIPVLPFGDSAQTIPQDPKILLLILETTDLEGLQRSLDRSSDHFEKSPQSLLQDILSAAGNVEEHEADCY